MGSDVQGVDTVVINIRISKYESKSQPKVENYFGIHVVINIRISKYESKSQLRQYGYWN